MTRAQPSPSIDADDEPSSSGRHAVPSSAAPAPGLRALVQRYRRAAEAPRPLAPLPHAADKSMEHRRADRRFDRQLAVDLLHEGATHHAQTRNISLGGAFLETDVVLPFGARVVLRFRVPTQADVVVVNGQVRWGEGGDDPRGQGLGVRFDGLRARDVWAINRFLGPPSPPRE